MSRHVLAAGCFTVSTAIWLTALALVLPESFSGFWRPVTAAVLTFMVLMTAAAGRWPDRLWSIFGWGWIVITVALTVSAAVMVAGDGDWIWIVGLVSIGLIYFGVSYLFWAGTALMLAAFVGLGPRIAPRE